VSSEIRDLIRQMSLANPLWGAPRIHGELLKLGCSSWAVPDGVIASASSAGSLCDATGPRLLA
jgi:hypothetical protein